MDQKLKDFIAETNGNIIGDTPENMGECVGLVECWADKFKIPHEYGNAKDLLANANPNFFNVIYNTADNVPLPGCIVVWGTQVGKNGHTSVYLGGDTNTFNSYDQNYPLDSPCHIQHHNYSGVIGWLQMKVVELPQVPKFLTTLFQEQNIDINDESAVRVFFQEAIDYPNLKADLESNKTQVINLDRRINDLNSINNEQANLIGSLNKDIMNLKAMIPASSLPVATHQPNNGFWAWLKGLFN